MSTDKQTIEDLAAIISQLEEKIATLEERALSPEEKLAKWNETLSNRYGYKDVLVHEIFHEIHSGAAISEEEKEAYENAVLDGWTPDWLDESDERWIQFINSDIYVNRNK